MTIKNLYIVFTRVFLIATLIIASNSNASLDRDSALMDAAKAQDLYTFNTLIEQGANLNHIPPGTKRNWVMCEVTRKGSENLLISALSNGGNVDLRTKLSATVSSAPILCAIGHHNFNALKILIDSGATVDIDACQGCQRYKYSPITVASMLNEYEMVSYLYELKKPADQDLKKLADYITRKPMLTTGSAAQWREKVTQKLRKNGIKVTPWTPKKITT